MRRQTQEQKKKIFKLFWKLILFFFFFFKAPKLGSSVAILPSYEITPQAEASSHAIKLFHENLNVG